MKFCSYVNRSRAYDAQLVYTQDDGTVIMKGDDTTTLDSGVFRERYILVYDLEFYDLMLETQCADIKLCSVQYRLIYS